jgi:broad specificity phosphatase PhoE
LHEHDRSNVAHMRSSAFISMVEAFFRRPGDLVLGRETADDAGDRFDRAVGEVLAKYPDGNVAVVAHGTVIALFLARHCGVRPFAVWRAMGLPSYAVLGVGGEGFALEERVDRV